MSEEDAIYRCPVCGDEFYHIEEADRHFDFHNTADYVVTWLVDDE